MKESIPASSTDIAHDVDVLIVGGGPSGLLQAYLLQKLNVSCLVIERYANRLGAPKAHALSPRSLEICRQFGLDTNQLRRLGTPRSEAYWVNFVTQLGKEPVGRLPYERMDPAVLQATPEMIHNIPQPVFEEFVAASLPEGFPIIKNASFISSEEKDDHVITQVEDRSGNQNFQVRSKFVIGCDGMRSKVRAHLGIECNGEDSYETMMTIHFNADLRPVVGDNVGMLHWVMDPAVSGFVIAYDLAGNQVLICNFDSEKHPTESWNEELARETVMAAIGKDVPFKVMSFRPWLLSRKVAEQYYKGRVFLAGDAAHAFPPTGGLGLNSGLADVHNLAYKVAANVHGWGGRKLLESYEERLHVAEVNSQQSVKNGKQIFSLLRAMGTTESDVDQARANLQKSLADPVLRAKVDKEILEQQEHFDNLELHLGYVYGSKVFPPDASDYTPKAVAGARLPHVWITPSKDLLPTFPHAVDLGFVKELSDQDRSARQYSSLDLCEFGAFTFIVNGKASQVVDEAVQRLTKAGVPVNVRALSKDFEVVNTEGSAEWSASLGLNAGGAVLVRPDQHIVALVDSHTTTDALVRLWADHLDIGEV